MTNTFQTLNQITFRAGWTYQGRRIIKRNDNWLWIEGTPKNFRRKINKIDGVENVCIGHYVGAPVLFADKPETSGSHGYRGFTVLFSKAEPFATVAIPDNDDLKKQFGKFRFFEPEQGAWAFENLAHKAIDKFHDEKKKQ